MGRGGDGVLIFLLVVAIRIAIAVGGYKIAKRKHRRAGVWGTVCLLLGLIPLIIIALLPSLKPAAPRIERSAAERGARQDSGEWQGLVAARPDVAAAVQQLRPHGEKYVTVMSRYLLASGDRKNVRAITDALIEKARADSQPDSLERLGRKVESLYRVPRGTAARLTDGTAVALVDGRLHVFSTLEDYRAYFNDRAFWPETTDPSERRAFIEVARGVLAGASAGERDAPEQRASDAPDYDARWQELARTDSRIVALEERLRPFGEKYVAALVAYAIESDDRRNLDAVTNALIDKARADRAGPAARPQPQPVRRSAPADQQALPYEIERSVRSIYQTARGPILGLHDGRVLARVDGQFRLFDSLRGYRNESGDYGHLQEIKEPDQKWPILGAARAHIERINNGQRA